MRYLFLLLLAFICFTSYGQTYEEETYTPVLNQGGIGYKILKEVYDSAKVFRHNDTTSVLATKYDIDTSTVALSDLESRVVTDSLKLDSISKGLIPFKAASGDDVLTLETTETNDDPNYTIKQARVATTDATQTTLLTIPITASRTYFIEAIVIARRTGGTAGTADDAAYYVRHSMFATISGTVNEYEDAARQTELQPAWDADWVVDGTNVDLDVTGAADNNVTWHCTVKISYVGT